MKRILRLLAAVLPAACLLVPLAAAQHRAGDVPRVSPNASVSQTIGITDVTITYGRPAVNGRVVFGELVPYGQVWRTGANEATTITFSSDVRVEGQPLAAGTYGLFTVPGETEWTIVFNRMANQWGAFRYDDEQDALRVTVRPETGPHTEQFTIAFDAVTHDEGRVVLAWDAVRVPFTIGTETDAAVFERARAAAAEADDWRDMVSYLFYFLEREVYVDEALAWAEQSVAFEETYPNLYAKANLHALLGQYAEAIRAGEKALAKGRAMENRPGNLGQLDARIAEWKNRI